MKKLLLAGLLAISAWFCASKAEAIQFDIPYTTQISTTNTSTIIFGTSTLPSTAYMTCFHHITAESNNAGQFSIITTSSSLVAGTTEYSTILASGTPLDIQWPTSRAWCGEPGNQVQLNVSAGSFRISAEEFTSKGINP